MSFSYLYLYSVQYLHVMQDSKAYMTHPTVQVQSKSQITDIPQTERQRLKDDHLSTSTPVSVINGMLLCFVL